MSASTHLSKPLFHGSSHYFKENEVIDPSFNRQNFFDMNNIKGAEQWRGAATFATSSLDRAKSRAANAAENAGMLFAPVYEVPSEKFTSFKDISPEFQPVSEGGAKDMQKHTDNYVTKEKVKPTKIAGWGVNPLADNGSSSTKDNFYAKSNR